jgi:hypothetical protein
METNETIEMTPEPQAAPMARPAFYYGLLTAIALMLLTLLIYFANLMEAKWVGWIGYLLLLAGILIGTKAFRDEYRGGFLSYGAALGFGTLTIFFASLITGAFTYLFYTLIAPDALAVARQVAETNALQANPNMTDQQLDMVTKMVNPLVMTISTVFSYTFLGFVMSLITSIFLKKKDPLEG